MRGGKRPGSGRPRNSTETEGQVPITFAQALSSGLGGGGPDRPLRRAVAALAGLAATTEEIAAALEQPVDRVKAEYANELAIGQTLQILQVASSVFRMATGRGRKENLRAAQFWLRSRAGWGMLSNPARRTR